MPQDRGALARSIEAAAADAETRPTEELRRLFEELKIGLNDGSIRAAEREGDRWVARPWVKKGILFGFRIGTLIQPALGGGFPFFEKDTFPVKALGLDSGVRIVPGGSAVRDGCYVAPGVTIMPPSYVNVGAWIGEGTLLDSHVLVGSCAQIGRRVHVSAGAQIGGVLEPVGELPVVVEDEVLVGGNCGIYEGAIVRERTVLAAGVVLTGGTPVYDVVRGEVYRKGPGRPLEIPAGAVVVPGSRAVRQGKGAEWGLSLQTPVIVKYRDEKTEASTTLEDLLR
ncbi:MAG TPA: 2,3,4,5-tetrahydropyridine-2,6-dicarboxylate N-succinyltransferase [Thermoanaerobaculia bacterium]|jgi:2,3,4,5-tetrahydropyridine-2-carboxylate N-succinyltransferase|nr:2,3,4,5-tetrahydropyridine-2,6-dicarboxylate N-succinyltransferase [Thermoanaerobaculia bacterium]